MKKLLEKDKKYRIQIQNKDYQHFVLKSIFKNFNFFILIRWNAIVKLKKLAKRKSKISLINRCLYTVNKKRFNKLTCFSRHVFLKLIRTGNIYGVKKISW
jgi:ribosomal protein S14